MKPKVLFVCTQNSCRSQMAEGFLRHHAADRFEAFSAGAEPAPVNPTAIAVMKEIGIDISGQQSKDVTLYLGKSFQFLIRVCDKVKEKCPVLPGAVWYRDWSFEDPAQAKGSSAERVAAFRRIRDEIEGQVLDFIAKES